MYCSPRMVENLLNPLFVVYFFKWLLYKLPVLYWISVMMLFFFRVSLSPSWSWQVFVTRDSKYVSHKFCCFDLASVVQRMGRTIQYIPKLQIMPLYLVVLIQWIMIYSLHAWYYPTFEQLYELFCKMTFVVFVLRSFIFFLNKLILEYIQRV